MKKLFYSVLLILSACSDNSIVQESLIVNYLETRSDGVRTDLKIDILSIEMSDVTVADSLAYLEAQFQEKIEKEKESIENFKLNIQGAKKENESLDRLNIDNLAKISANKAI